MCSNVNGRSNRHLAHARWPNNKTCLSAFALAVRFWTHANKSSVLQVYIHRFASTVSLRAWLLVCNVFPATFVDRWVILALRIRASRKANFVHLRCLTVLAVTTVLRPFWVPAPPHVVRALIEAAVIGLGVVLARATGNTCRLVMSRN